MKRAGIVPLDGSAVAECALPWATTVAGALGLRLVLVQLVPEAWPGGDERAEAALRPAQHYLNGVAASLGMADMAIETKAQPVGEDVAAGIIGAATSLDAALIILSTRGRSGPRRWALGSVADAVVRGAGCPVLVVRAAPGTITAGRPAIRRVLLPLDGSEPSEAALPLAQAVATAFGATLDLVQAVPWPTSVYSAGTEAWVAPELDEQLEQAAVDYLAGVAARLPREIMVEQHILRGSPAVQLLDHAERSRADLIVMTTHGRAGVSRWVLGSIADRLVRTSDLPVLLARGGAAEPEGPAGA